MTEGSSDDVFATKLAQRCRSSIVQMKKSLQADKTLTEGSSGDVFATKLAQRCRSSIVQVKKSLQADAFRGACAELTRAMARVDFDTALVPQESLPSALSSRFLLINMG